MGHRACVAEAWARVAGPALGLPTGLVAVGQGRLDKAFRRGWRDAGAAWLINKARNCGVQPVRPNAVRAVRDAVWAAISFVHDSAPSCRCFAL